MPHLSLANECNVGGAEPTLPERFFLVSGCEKVPQLPRSCDYTPMTARGKAAGASGRALRWRRGRAPGPVQRRRSAQVAGLPAMQGPSPCSQRRAGPRQKGLPSNEWPSQKQAQPCWRAEGAVPDQAANETLHSRAPVASDLGAQDHKLLQGVRGKCFDIGRWRPAACAIDPSLAEIRCDTRMPPDCAGDII